LSNFGDCGINLTTSFLLFNIDLELKRRLIGVLIHGSDLSIPRVLRVKLNIEDKHNITSLSFLCDDDLLRAINNEVTSLVIETLFVLHNLFFGASP
jgi:hypothetical protein